MGMHVPKYILSFNHFSDIMFAMSFCHASNVVMLKCNALYRLISTFIVVSADG